MGDLKWLAGLFLALVLVLSGLAKLAHWARFRDTLAAMELVPAVLVSAIAAALSVVEIGLGAWVATGWQCALSAFLVIGLFSAFIVGLAVYRWRGGNELVCGCFADFEHKASTASLITRNGLLLVAALPLLTIPEAPPAHNGAQWLVAG